MSLRIVAHDSQQGNFQHAAELQTAIFRAEAFSRLLADPAGAEAFAQLDEAHRAALLNAHADALTAARELADSLS